MIYRFHSLIQQFSGIGQNGTQLGNAQCTEKVIKKRLKVFSAPRKFADDRDRNALILLNCSEIRENLANDITLTLDVCDITVYRRGLPTRIHDDNGVFTIHLDSCEGVFVTIG